jgi:hypothetical protein
MFETEGLADLVAGFLVVFVLVAVVDLVVVLACGSGYAAVAVSAAAAVSDDADAAAVVLIFEAQLRQVVTILCDWAQDRSIVLRDNSLHEKRTHEIHFTSQRLASLALSGLQRSLILFIPKSVK